MPHHLDYAAAVRRDGLALAAAAEAAGPAVPVPSCPGWDVAELVWHITEVHFFWSTIVERRLADPREVPPLDRPVDFPALLASCRRGAERLADVLAAADPAAPVWTWARQKDAAFVIRHQAHETAIHCWDAEQAGGRPSAINAALAADAIDEFLEHTGAARAEEAEPLGGSVHLHVTDGEGEWTVTEGESGRLVVGRGHRPGDAALRGGASDLLLLLYRRISLDAVEHFGDRALLERFLARADLS